MKKYFVFSLLAMLSCAAWADFTFEDVSYYVRVTNVNDPEGKFGLDGTIPSAVTVKLVDTGYSSEPIYTQRIDFNNMEVDTEHSGVITLSTANYINPVSGRLNLSELVKVAGRVEGTADYATIVMNNENDQYGLNISSSDSMLPEDVYKNPECQGMTKAQLIAYINKNLRTYLVSDDGEVFEIRVDATGGPDKLNSSSDMGSLKPQPVPEPTSGLLLLMGLAGLALKRRRVA